MEFVNILKGASYALAAGTRRIATLMFYVDEHDRQRTQHPLADHIAGGLIA